MKIALKVDVDTYRGTLEGVPRLAELLHRYGAGATFLFSLGPDHTGRAIRRVFRPGFMKKVSRTSVVEHYGIRTLLYGTVLPGPDIGRRCASLMRSVRDGGFEVGIHTWDHVRWQDYVSMKNEAWTRRELDHAATRFMEVFGESARVHGAAGWQMNDAAYRYLREAGFAYCSDSRGTHPYRPVLADGSVGIPQYPTTLPTLDEIIGTDGVDASNAAAYVMSVAGNDSPTGHVYTLHAELEGGKLLPVMEALLAGWQERGHELVSLAALAAATDNDRLPLHAAAEGTIPGRSGTLAIQGPPAPG